MWSAMTLLDEARSSLELGRHDLALGLLWLAVERSAAERDAAALTEIHALARGQAAERDDWRPLLDRAELHLVELTGRVPTILPEPAAPAAPRRRLLAQTWPQLVGLLLALASFVYVGLVVRSLG
jgi:hypothetical protein